MSAETGDASDKDSILVSLRLAPDVARAFKMEAARRNLRLNQLFAEVWRAHEEATRAPR